VEEEGRTGGVVLSSWMGGWRVDGFKVVVVVVRGLGVGCWVAGAERGLTDPLGNGSFC